MGSGIFRSVALFIIVMLIAWSNASTTLAQGYNFQFLGPCGESGTASWQLGKGSILALVISDNAPISEICDAAKWGSIPDGQGTKWIATKGLNGSPLNVKTGDLLNTVAINNANVEGNAIFIKILKGFIPSGTTWGITGTSGTSVKKTGTTSIVQLGDIPPDLPGAPTNLVGTPGNGKATIAFTAANDGGGTISTYEYDINGNDVWQTLNSATSPVTITGLFNGTAFNIRLRARNQAGAGPPSSPVSVTPRPDPPAAPTITSVTGGDQKLTVAFTAGDNGGATITNYSYSTNGTTYTAFSPAKTTSPLTISGLTNGTSYNVTIKAINSQGEGTASNSVSGTPFTVPGAPTITTATPGNASAEIVFTAPSSNGGSTITDYEVKVDNGNWISINKTSSPYTVPSNYGLANGVESTILLRAVNAAGGGAASASIKVTPRTIPTSPVNVQGTKDDLNATVTLTWLLSFDGGSPITKYTVTSSPDSKTCEVTQPSQDGSLPKTCTVTGLTRGTPYTFTVKATNIVGESNASSASPSFTIPVKIPQTITFGTIAQKTWGDADFQLGPATTDQNQTVTFTAADPTIVQITGNMAKLLKVGTTKITASQDGNALYFPATSIEQTLTVVKAPQTITFAALADKTYEDPEYVLGPDKTDKGQTITYTSSDPLTVSITGNKATLLKGGTVTITASQAGDDFYLPATPVQQTQKVNKAPQSIAFLALADRTYGDPPIEFSPTLSNKNLPVVFTSSMPNVVLVSGSQGTILRGGPVLQNGDIQPVIITASQAGDDRYLPATVSWPLTVYRAPQSVSLNFIPTKTYGDFPFTMSPVLSSAGLPVSYATSDPTIISLDNNTGTINKSGVVSITVSQSGDERYLPAPNYVGLITVLKAALSITPAANQGKDYGATDPVISYQATGFVNGQDVSILAGGLGRQAGELPGTYAVTLGDLGFKQGYEDRYEFGLKPASFEIRIVDTDKDLVPDHIEDEEGSNKLDINSYKDTDGDKVPNFVETVIDKSDPAKSLEFKDTDGDLVPDYIENRDGTDPSDKTKFKDTDKGGVPDYVEVTYFLNFGVKAGNPDAAGDDGRDFDGDEVTDYREIKDKTKLDEPTSFQDSDGDGVPDEVEERDSTDPSDKSKYRDTDGDLVPNYVEKRETGGDPDKALVYGDADGDLVPDYIEKRDGTDLSDRSKYKDTDKGGVPDYVEEVYYLNKGLNPSDPNKADDDGRDSDGDEVSDYREFVDGSDISDVNSFKDRDGDGVPDQVEERDNTNPDDKIDYRDSDGDLVPDYVERRTGSSSRIPLSFKDTDGDLVPDYIETRDGTDLSDSTKFKDTDKGGTPDYVEQVYYAHVKLPLSDINKASDDGRDTDGDGKSDYFELVNGTNPDDEEDYGFKKGTGSCFNPYDPYIVETLFHLNAVRLEPDKCYLQTRDIDARPTQQWNQGRGFAPIGSDGTAFSGWYDGGYHRITGLYIDVPVTTLTKPDDAWGAALFGKVMGSQERAAIISRVLLDSVKVSGDDNVAALAGYAEWANLTEVSSRGELQASGQRVGGLVGHGRQLTIDQASSQATITGTADWKGGLAGALRRSRVSNAYFAGRMSASERSAGLVAFLEQTTLTNTYAAMLGTSTGQNSTNSLMSGIAVEATGSQAVNTFWEVTESNVSRGSLGKAGTTVQMMDANRFTGWDFSQTWAIASGDSISYPYLRSMTRKQLPGHRPASYLQVIHNMATGAVRVEIDEVTRVNSLTPEGATPYLALPSGAAFEVKLVSVATGKTKASFMSTPLKPSEAYLIYATGGEDDTDGELITLEDTKRQAETPDKVDIIFVNGANAYPRLDLDYITNNSPATVQKNIGRAIPFGEKSDYSSLNFTTVKSFRLGANGSTLGEFNFSMEGLKGKAFKIVALGNGTAKQAGSISLVAVTPEGKVINARIGTSLEESEVPSGFALYDNFPNPFNPSTNLRFDLPETAKVSVQVVDLMGRVVMSTEASTVPAGTNRSLSLDASRLATGVYLYRLTAVGNTKTYTAVGRFALIK